MTNRYRWNNVDTLDTGGCFYSVGYETSRNMKVCTGCYERVPESELDPLHHYCEDCMAAFWDNDGRRFIELPDFGCVEDPKYGDLGLGGSL